CRFLSFTMRLCAAMRLADACWIAGSRIAMSVAPVFEAIGCDVDSCTHPGEQCMVCIGCASDSNRRGGEGHAANLGASARSMSATSLLRRGRARRLRVHAGSYQG